MASRMPIKLLCSFSFWVINPIVAKTATFISAKETPIAANSNLKNQKSFEKGVIKQNIATIYKPDSIAFFNPILGKKDAIIKAAIAIGMSLNPSNKLAVSFSIL